MIHVQALPAAFLFVPSACDLIVDQPGAPSVQEALRKAARMERFAKGGGGGGGDAAAGADAADKAKARAERFGISGKSGGTKGAPKEAGKRDAQAAAGASAAAADFEAKKKVRSRGQCLGRLVASHLMRASAVSALL